MKSIVNGAAMEVTKLNKRGDFYGQESVPKDATMHPVVIFKTLPPHAKHILNIERGPSKRVSHKEVWTSIGSSDNVRKIWGSWIASRHQSFSKGRFESWLSRVADLSMDFSKADDIESFGFVLSECKEAELPILKLIEAVRDYKEELADGASPISESSARSYLIIAVLLVNYEFDIYFDSNNGCVSVDISTGNKEILATQFSSDSRVHFSLVGRGKKIFKLSGTAKFKDEVDFVNFDKILRLL